MNDIINKLQLEITCSSEEQAFELRHNIVHAQQTRIIEAIEDCLRKYSGLENWLVIDKLEIDLGNFWQLAFENEFEHAFKRKFEEALHQEISQRPPELNNESNANYLFQLVTRFLTKGLLPWWANDSDIDIDEIFHEILKSNPELLTVFLKDNFHQKYIWERISFQLNPETQIQIITLFDELKSAVELFTSWIKEAKIVQERTDSFKQNEFLEEVQKHRYNLTRVEPIVIRFTLSYTPLIIHARGKISSLRKIYDTNLRPILVDKGFSNPVSSASEFNHNIGDEYDNIDSRIEEKINQVVEAEIDDEKIAIRMAGMVLIAPFLKALFTNLKWYLDGQWSSKMAQFKAVHLLKFIGTGDLSTSEYKLTLEKICCGLTREESLPIEVPITALEKDEAINMLNSVIEHWQALKNTSVDSLRNTFFQRDGMLQKMDNGWKLQVERKTVDVLIDKIPWGIEKIILPWNDYIIFVEW